MPEPRHEYVETRAWSREQIELALRDDDAPALRRAVIAVAMHASDGRYAQDVCIRLSRHADWNVRSNAVLGFGHVARVHGELDRFVVQPTIRADLHDENDYIRGQANCAKDDTEAYLAWS